MQKQFINFYEILGVKKDATAKEISTAYRTMALRHHPDKSTGPSAVQQFHSIVQAYQILTDIEARAAFDRLLISKEVQRIRVTELDEQRKNMREDLLRREREARKRKAEEEAAEVKLRAEMERFKKESQFRDERLEEEAKEARKVEVFDELDRTLKFTSSYEEIISEEEIRSILEGYGKIEDVVIGKKGTQGLIRLDDVLTAKAIIMDSEYGQFKNIKFEWTKGHPPQIEKVQASSQLVTPKDFESLTLMRMRQHAERNTLKRKLEEQPQDP